MPLPSSPSISRLPGSAAPPTGTERRRRTRASCVRAFFAHAPRRKLCAPPSPLKMRALNRCPTPARRSGTWRTRPGSSRRSCSAGTTRLPRAPTRVTRILFNSYYEALGAAHRAARSAGCSRGPTVDEVLAYRAHVDAAMARAARAPPATPAQLDALRVVELGLHHEQQHQELILTDIKHVLGQNPLRPAYAAGGRRAPPRDRPAPARWRSTLERRSGRDRPRRRGLRVRQRAPAPPRVLAAVRLGRRARHERRVPRRSSTTAAIDAPGALALRRLATVQPSGSGRRRSTGRRTGATWMASSRSAGVAARSTRTSRCATSATTRPTPSRAGPARGCRPRRSGSTPRADAPVDGNLVESGPLPPAPPADAAERARAAVRRRLGVDAERVRRRTPASRRSRARSANTTASSCATRWCCAAARAPRRGDHVRASYRNFFPPAARWQFSGHPPGEVRMIRDVGATPAR